VTPTFAVSGLSFRYPKAIEDALEGASLTVPSDATTAVLGLSGSGKTTLLHLLGLLNQAASVAGQIVYGGKDDPVDYSTLSGGRRAELRRRDFGFVLQDAYLLPHLTCAENIAMPLALQALPPAQQRERVEALLTKADRRKLLLGRGDYHPRDVSGGERQRMAVLRAVVHDPRVLFADEPVSNLDPRNTRRVLRLLRAWRRGKLHPGGQTGARSLVLVSHNIALAYRLANHFILLRRGRVVEGRTLPKAEVMARGGPAALRALIGA
jgi:ABC-type lipoprotein export system ATPase subunit